MIVPVVVAPGVSVGEVSSAPTIDVGSSAFASPKSRTFTVPTLTPGRSEEHTSELQSQFHLVCRLLLEKKKKIKKPKMKTKSKLTNRNSKSIEAIETCKACTELTRGISQQEKHKAVYEESMQMIKSIEP